MQSLRPGPARLVGEPSTRSEEFRTRWAARNVLPRRPGNKLINHPSSDASS
jgi:MmyB-like transcription regulator ligand binding domain